MSRLNGQILIVAGVTLIIPSVILFSEVQSQLSYWGEHQHIYTLIKDDQNV